MTKTATVNGNGQRKWWFLAPVLTIGGVVFGAGMMKASIENGVKTNAAKNIEQDECIDRNTSDIHRLENIQGRIDERLKNIQADVQTLVQRSGGG